jgi:dipeptidyl aminopeptidase/acylaminoacyl peptidase
VINYSEGPPWKVEETMRNTSPLFDVDKVTTPTLIHVGENDERVPQEHSRSLYRALRHYLKVPTELIIYPGAGHGLTKYSHRKAKISWDVKWFNNHVLGRVDEELE